MQRTGDRSNRRGAQAHFRFQDSAAYHEVGGQGIREMDHLWWDGETLWLVEVMSSRFAKSSEMLGLCREKARDTLLMLLSMWASTAWGARLSDELPGPMQTCPKRQGRLKLVFVVTMSGPSSAFDLSTHQVALRNHLRGILGVAGRTVDDVLLLDRPHAEGLGLPTDA